MAETVTVPAEAATEATKQEDNEYDDEYKSNRHDPSPLQHLADFGLCPTSIPHFLRARQEENSTANLAPWSLSPRPLRSSPPIRSTKDRMILIPSPLQAAGPNPSG